MMLGQEEIDVVGKQKVVSGTLLEDWRAGRDELVQASFIQFDGHVYSIHSQIRQFALTRLPLEERRRIHRLIAAYYRNLTQPRAEEIYAAFEHLEAAGEPQDLLNAVQIAMRALQEFKESIEIQEWKAMQDRAELYSARLNREPEPPHPEEVRA